MFAGPATSFPRPPHQRRQHVHDAGAAARRQHQNALARVERREVHHRRPGPRHQDLERRGQHGRLFGADVDDDAVRLVVHLRHRPDPDLARRALLHVVEPPQDLRQDVLHQPPPSYTVPPEASSTRVGTRRSSGGGSRHTSRVPTSTTADCPRSRSFELSRFGPGDVAQRVGGEHRHGAARQIERGGGAVGGARVAGHARHGHLDVDGRADRAVDRKRNGRRAGRGDSPRRGLAGGETAAAADRLRQVHDAELDERHQHGRRLEREPLGRLQLVPGALPDQCVPDAVERLQVVPEALEHGLDGRRRRGRRHGAPPSAPSNQRRTTWFAWRSSSSPHPRYRPRRDRHPPGEDGPSRPARSGARAGAGAGPRRRAGGCARRRGWCPTAPCATSPRARRCRRGRRRG